MTNRASFSRKERERLFVLYKGECYLCGGKIIAPAEVWEIEHVIPWELTRDNRDNNLRLAHFTCHKEKTAKDVRRIRKADRQRANYNGTKVPSRTPMRFGRHDFLKKKMNGDIVERK